MILFPAPWFPAHLTQPSRPVKRVPLIGGHESKVGAGLCRRRVSKVRLAANRENVDSVAVGDSLPAALQRSCDSNLVGLPRSVECGKPFEPAVLRLDEQGGGTCV